MPIAVRKNKNKKILKNSFMMNYSVLYTREVNKMGKDTYSFCYDSSNIDKKEFEEFDDEDIEGITQSVYSEENVLNNINHALKQRNITKKELAETMLHNKKNKMALEDFLKIAVVLDLPLSYFTSDSNANIIATNSFENVYSALEYIGWKYDYHYQLTKAKKPNISKSIKHIYNEFNNLEKRKLIKEEKRLHD